MRKLHAAPEASRTLARLVLAVFILALMCSVCHAGCCSHSGPDDDCPCCAAIRRLEELLRLTVFFALAAKLKDILTPSGKDPAFSGRAPVFRSTPVSLRDKLLN